MAERMGPADQYDESEHQPYGSRGVPITLKCPECNSTLNRDRTRRESMIGIIATGRRSDDVFKCSRETGSYYTRKYEVRHKKCGHSWWSVHPEARRLWEHDFGGNDES